MVFICSDCGFQFTHRHNLLRHLRERHKVGYESKFKCSKCDKSYTRKSKLDEHLSIFHPSSPTLTPPPENSSPSLPQTSPLTSGEFLLPPPPTSALPKNQLTKCRNSHRESLASDATSYIEPPRLDTLTPLDSKPSTLAPPPQCSSSSVQLQPPQPPRFKCTECGRSYRWRGDFLEHMKTFHPLITVNPSTSASPPQCSSSSGQLQPPQPPMFQCTECGNSFKRRKDFLNHMRNFHPHKSLSSSDQCPPMLPPMFHCALCGKLYTWKKSLARHLRTHSHSPTPPQCFSKAQITPEYVPVPVEGFNVSQTTPTEEYVGIDTLTNMKPLSQTELDNLLEELEVDSETFTNIEQWSPSEFESQFEDLQTPIPADCFNMTQSTSGTGHNIPAQGYDSREFSTESTEEQSQL